MTRAKDISKILTDADISGNIDVDGVTNLDVVDIDGAVDMASTLIVDGKVGLGIDPSTLPSFVNHAMKISNGGGLSITSPSAGDNRLIFFGTGTSSADIQLAGIKNTSSDFIFLGESGAERFKIHNNGVVAPLNGIALGVGTANTASNVLDDYEQGTWTAELRGGSARASTPVISTTATYVKTGRSVFVQAYFPNVNTTGASGTMTITGLPFTAINSLQLVTCLTYGIDFDDATAVMGIAFYIEGNNNANLIAAKDNAAWQATDITAGTGKYVAMTGTYYTNA